MMRESRWREKESMMRKSSGGKLSPLWRKKWMKKESMKRMRSTVEGKGVHDEVKSGGTWSQE
jgi:hypothetical protein